MASIWICISKILLASHLFCMISSSSNGFSSKLIYRDSPLSQSNHSYLRAFWRDIKTSRSRASNLIHGDTLQLSLFFQEPLFTLEVGIGTPTTEARLVFDTVAPITWTQCKPCSRCFEQDFPVLDPSKSSSFRRMPKNHTLSSLFVCTDDPECYYTVATGGGVSSEGVLSMDTFSFLGTLKELRNIVFGCGTRNIKFGLRGQKKMMFTGILGMGNYPTSLVHQLGDRVMHKFSYCLPALRSSKTKRSDLRFGEKAAFINGKNVQTTPFLPQIKQGPLLVQSSYRLNLLGISLVRKRLEIPQGSFSEGCIIDTGSPFSIINSKAYNVLLNAMSSYFSQFKNIKTIANRKYPKNGCYKYTKGFRNFPSMTLHFEGANLQVNGTSLFMFGRDLPTLSNFICLQMWGGPTNILGVYQQQNVRFLYDLRHKKLSFAREDC